MGACLSCLGLRRDSGDQADRARLLYDDYNQNGHAYGTWGNSAAPPQNVMSPEEVRREQEALDNITRWASDQIVEIFPYQHRNLISSTSQLNGNGTGENTTSAAAPSDSHQDILLSMIPGDKSKRSIRIYPASRPSSKDAQSVRSKASHSKLNGSVKGKGSGVFVKLDVNIP